MQKASRHSVPLPLRTDGAGRALPFCRASPDPDVHHHQLDSDCLYYSHLHHLGIFRWALTLTHSSDSSHTSNPSQDDSHHRFSSLYPWLCSSAYLSRPISGSECHWVGTYSQHSTYMPNPLSQGISCQPSDTHISTECLYLLLECSLLALTLGICLFVANVCTA